MDSVLGAPALVSGPALRAEGRGGAPGPIVPVLARRVLLLPQTWALFVLVLIIPALCYVTEVSDLPGLARRIPEPTRDAGPGDTTAVRLGRGFQENVRGR